MIALLVSVVIPMIFLWCWAMLRGWPYWASLSAALGIAPVLQLAAGLLAGRISGAAPFYSVPFGGAEFETLPVTISLIFWMAVTGWPSFRLASNRRHRG